MALATFAGSRTWLCAVELQAFLRNHPLLLRARPSGGDGKRDFHDLLRLYFNGAWKAPAQQIQFFLQPRLDIQASEISVKIEHGLALVSNP
jgi:hypothetical protein